MTMGDVRYICHPTTSAGVRGQARYDRRFFNDSRQSQASISYLRGHSGRKHRTLMDIRACILIGRRLKLVLLRTLRRKRSYLRGPENEFY